MRPPLTRHAIRLRRVHRRSDGGGLLPPNLLGGSAVVLWRTYRELLLQQVSLIKRQSVNPTSRRSLGKLSDINLHPGPDSRFRRFEERGRNLLIHVGLAAILTNLRRHVLEDNRHPCSFECDGGFAKLGAPFLTDRACHVQRLLSKPGSQRLGSGS